MRLARVLAVAVLVGACSTPPKIAPVVPVPAQDHIWLFVMENRSYDDVIGSPSAPYIDKLAKTYGLAANYFATTQPSLPNYLALIAGSTMGCGEDPNCGGFDERTIAGQLTAAGKRWAGYFEGMPSPGYAGPDTGDYVKHHNPFVSFSEIAGDPGMRANMHPFTDFAASLRDPAAFTLVVPNNADNMHDGTVAQGDAWLARTIPPVLASDGFKKGGTIFITWDESVSEDRAGCCLKGIDGGHVGTVVISSTGKRGFVSTTPHTHVSLLATMQQALGLPRLLQAREVTAMAEFWSAR